MRDENHPLLPIQDLSWLSAEAPFNAEAAREWLSRKLGVGRYALTIEHVDTDLWSWATKTESGVVYPLNDRSGWAFEYDV